MTRRFAAACLAAGVLTAAVALAQPAAEPLRFKWQPGQTLTYRVIQHTTVRETQPDEKTKQPATTETKTALTLLRKWTVKDADAAGVATLEMQITEIKNEFRQPDGTTVTRDSTNPEHAKELAAFLNTPIVVVRVDGQGRIVEVKPTNQGTPARLHAELPFRVTLPDAGPTPGQTWDRAFAVKLDPPLGTGESYDFVQKYNCKAVKDGLAVVGIETTLKAPPKTAGEQVPLVPMLWHGEVYFNTVACKYHAARLTAKAELPDHLGDGTKFVYESSYAEDVVEK
jgi:hypothetical protein